MIRRLTTVLSCLAVIAVLTLLLMPGTRWVMRSHCSRSMPPEMETMDAYFWDPDKEDEEDLRAREAVVHRWLPRLDAFAARHADDAGLQVAHALRGVSTLDAAVRPKEASRRLRALQPRYTDDPVVLASILGNECGLFPSKKSAATPSPALIAAFDRVAARGERADPTNAYFPALRAVGLLAAGREQQAFEALHRASIRPTWKDYSEEIIRGQIRLIEGFGRPGNPLVATRASIGPDLPHLPALKHLAERTVDIAAGAEKAGRPEEGLRLRHDMMRLGALMRTRGRSIITNLTGASITTIATGRPGGAPDIRKAAPSLTGKQRAQARRDAYDRYLQRLGHEDERRWVRTQLDAGVHDRTIYGDSISRFDPLTLLVVYTGFWGGSGLFVLPLAIWLAVVAFGSWILEGIHKRAGKRLFSAAVWGIVAALATGEAIRLARVLGASRNVVLGAAGICAVLAAVAAVLSRSRFLGWFCGAFVASMLIQMALPGAATTLPVLAIVTGLMVRKSRDRVYGLRRVRAWAIPLAAVTTLVYAGLVFRAGSDRARLISGLDQMSTHEGRFYADLVGREWR